ncbi:hypothetical protein BJ684DRAFT_17404 [Piptocephalis cylindrospora]|uniref:Uncharacterized protein n=1 Tax=Piptocephalis cylindrospora TaxID=1907219 RepID=A0A4P9Y099_9FUNG|nr:hypothetical protein BJ684DRAFT_17404 [Piptocephalis cylindrospora]|eukprot:RKP12074.1 hypothetical protein BJ684DRAFT_17404 [Piptocephalis cylindrospora]
MRDSTRSNISNYLLGPKSALVTAGVAAPVVVLLHLRCFSQAPCTSLVLQFSSLNSFWLGMTSAISLMEAPVKFTAPTPSVSHILDVGRHVFSALHHAEIVLSLLSLSIATTLERRGCILWQSWSTLAKVSAWLPPIIVLTQGLFLWPTLREAVEARVQGRPSTSKGVAIHQTYTGTELLKILSLAITGLQLSRQAGRIFTFGSV